MATYKWPPIDNGSGSGVPVYANLAGFPSGSAVGDLAVAADTGNLYEWNGSAWVLEASPSGAGPAPGSNGDLLYSSSSVITADTHFTTDGSGGLSAASLQVTGALSGVSLNLSGLTASRAVITDGSKNLASLVYTSLPTVSTLVSRDSSGNASFVNVNGGSTSTVSSGQTITMTAANTQIQKATGTSAITYKLPDATTLLNGALYCFDNASTQSMTVQDSAAGAIATVLAGAYLEVVCVDNSSAAGVWDAHWLMPSNAAYGTAGLTVTGTLHITGNSTLSGTGNSVGTITSGIWNGTTIAIANGGTGQVTAGAAFNALSPMTASGDLIYGGTSGAGTRLAKGSDTQVLTLASGLPTWAAPSFTSPMTTLGDIIYENATPAAARLAGNTSSTKNFLTQTGNGSISAIPAWGTIAGGDVPAINLASTSNGGVTGTLPVGNGGTGQASNWNANGVVYASSTTIQASTTVGTALQVLTSNGSGNAPTFNDLPTASYAQAYQNIGTSWVSNSSSYSDPTATGTATLTVRRSSGITLTTAGINLAGITFTPVSTTAVYLISANVTIAETTGIADVFGARLFDGTQVIAQAPDQRIPATSPGIDTTIFMQGIYAPASTSAQTVKVQLWANTSSMTIPGTVQNGNAIEWTVLRIL